MESSKDDSEWTVQVSKPRRLAPQFTLSKKDLGADSTKSAPVTPSGNTASSHAAPSFQQDPNTVIKKKVIKRFSKEELLNNRGTPREISEEKIVQTDIISGASLAPVSLSSIDIDELLRAWAAERAASREQRVKGPQRSFSAGQAGESEREGGRFFNNSRDLWDDTGSADMKDGAGDLAAFAEAAIRFRSSTKEIALLGKETAEEKVPDALDSLIDGASHLDLDEDDIPEWAEIGSEELSVSVTDLERNRSETQRQISSEKPMNDEENIMTKLLNAKNSSRTIAEVLNPPSVEIVPVQSLALKEADLQLPPIDQSHLLVADNITQSFSVSPQPSPIPILHDESINYWFYLDPSSNVQGPFQSNEMRTWLEAGYFESTLPVRLAHWRQFHPLASVFQSKDAAFRVAPAEPGTLFPPTPPIQSLLQIPQLSQSQHIYQQSSLLMQQQQQHYGVQQMPDVLLSEQHAIQQRAEQLAQQQRAESLAQQQRAEQLAQQQRAEQLAQQQRAEQLAQQQRAEQLAQQLRAEQLAQQQRAELIAQQQRAEQLLQQQREQQQLAEQYEQQQRQLAEQLALQKQREEQLAQQQRAQQEKLIEQQRAEELFAQQRAEQLAHQVRLEELAAQQRRDEELAVQREHQANQSKPMKKSPHVDSENSPQTLASTPDGIKSSTSKKSSPWATAALPAAPAPLSLRDIQEEEARQKPPIETASTQLKSILGVGISGAGWGVEKPVAVGPKPSLRSIQDEQLEEVLSQPKVPASPIGNESGAPLGSPASGNKWQLSQPEISKSTRSLLEIMEEENAQRQQKVAENPTAHVVAASSWAAKAGSSSHGGYVAAPAPAVSVAMNPSRPQPSAASIVALSAGAKVAPVSSGNTSVRLGNDQAGASAAATSSTQGKKCKSGDSGIGGLSSDFAEWCSSQLVKINCNGDLTLVQFCASLASASEIREHFAAYLGSTPQVSHFATEFIRRKESGAVLKAPAASSTGVTQSTASTVAAAVRVSSPSFSSANNDFKKVAKKKKAGGAK